MMRSHRGDSAARSRIARGLLAAVSLTLAVPESRAGHHYVYPQTAACVPACGPTELQAGDESDDLRVHIVGRSYDTIEAFFRNEMVRDALPQSMNLHCFQSVLLAPKNPFGTFAVRYGPRGEFVKVYGWKKDEARPQTRALSLEPGYPVRMEWVTTRILKVRHGAYGHREVIVRFNDADVAWTGLLSTAE